MIRRMLFSLYSKFLEKYIFLTVILRKKILKITVDRLISKILILIQTVCSKTEVPKTINRLADGEGLTFAILNSTASNDL